MVRFAVIGTNFITERFLTAAAECGEFLLSAVYSRTEEKGRAFAERYGVKKVYTDLYGLACDLQIDAVYIASPTCCHMEQAVMMMKHGKHVLCEKPAASNLHELQKMIAAAQKNQVIFLEAMRPVFHPGMKVLQRLLPQIGQMRRAQLTFCQYSSRYDKFKNGIMENAFRPELSNGALMDIGSYCIHTAVYLFGMPRKIQSLSMMLPDSIDGEGTVLLDYGSFQGNIHYSKITNTCLASEFQGEEGCILVDKISEPGSIRLIPYHGEEMTYHVKEKNDMRFELRAFLDAVQKGGNLLPYHQASIDALSVMDTVRGQCGIVFPADRK
jgi:predicted dehydrogenase